MSIDSSEMTKQFINLNVGYYGIPLHFSTISTLWVSSLHLTFFLRQQKEQKQSVTQRCHMTALQVIQNAVLSMQVTSNNSYKSNQMYSEMRHPALLQRGCFSQTWLLPSQHNNLHEVIIFQISSAHRTTMLDRSLSCCW